MICASGGNAWIVSPYEAEVSRSWYSRNDPVTRAQQVSGCTGWFTPTLAQYQNPGYTCRTYWDSYSPTNYWTLDKRPGTGSFFYLFNMENAVVNIGPPYPAGWGNGIHCVRAFRCVTY